MTVAARTYTVAAGNWLAAQFITDADLKPETANAVERRRDLAEPTASPTIMASA